MNILRLALALSVAFVLGLAFGATSAEATPQIQNPYQVIAQLGRVLVQIENSYVDPVERSKLLEGAIKGMVENLDPHSAYLPPEEWTQFQNDTEGKFAGIGLEIDGRNERLVVIAPIDGSPAARAGIRSGDEIVSVDDEDVRGESLDHVVKRMRGEAGSKIRLGIRRVNPDQKPGVSETGVPVPDGPPQAKARADRVATFELTREIIHVASVTSKLLTGGLAYVRIRQFQEHAHEELLRALTQLRAQSRLPLRGVLLDVRSNPGGLVDEATEIADEFLSDGGIYSMRHRGRVVEDLKAKPGGSLVDLPVVALVNEWSASASELLVGALQDNRRATVVGANTFGKGSVQSVLSLPNGAGLKLTTARYYTPSGHAIQADGIHPDVALEGGDRETGPRILRERDLPGHLAAEAPGAKGQTQPGGKRIDAGSDEDLRTIASEVPDDPSRAADVALRVGYRLLLDRAGSR